MSALAPYRLGLLLVTASAIAWSTAGLFTRLLATDLATTLFWRGIFGAIGVFAFILFEQRRQAFAAFGSLGRHGWALIAVSAFGMLSYISSLRLTTVAHVAIIYGVAPLLAAGLGWLVLRERPGGAAIMASIAAFLGVAVMTGFGVEGSLAGDGLALLMTLCMAAIMVMARKWQGTPMLQVACLSSLVSAAMAAPLAVPLSPTGWEWLTLMGFGLVNSALGLALFSLGSKLLPPVETALITALDAPLAPVWVWLALGERPSAATLLGGGIVFAAVMSHILIGSRATAAVE